MRKYLLVLILVLAPTATRFAGAERPDSDALAQDRREAVRQIHRDAFEHPGDDARFKAFTETLPKFGGYYIVEGDISLTEQELHGYVAANAHTNTRAEAFPLQTIESTVNRLPNGQPDFYSDVNARRLKYAVDRQSFPTQQQYELVVRGMAKAGKAWEEICPECKVRFDYHGEYDANPDMGLVNFVIRRFNSNGEFVALSFFPHDPPIKRYVAIDPTYFSAQFDADFQVGVLRHELGHVLGYRHEQVRGIPGCDREDNQWVPLTTYDPKSVMHYFCGGGGNMKLEISDLDKAGHRKLYGLSLPNTPSQPSATAFQPGARSKESKTVTGTLVVRFEGGDIISDVAKVLARMVDLGVIETHRHTVTAGETLEKIYRKHLDLPSYSDAITNFANGINGADFKKRPLKAGDTVVYPKVNLDSYKYSRKFDLTSREELAEFNRINVHWNHAKVHNDAEEGKNASYDPNLVRVTLRGYEMKLDVHSPALLAEATAALSDLERKNIHWSINSKDPAKYHSAAPSGASTDVSTQDARTFWRDHVSTPADENTQGDLGMLIGMPLASARHCGAPCPTVILIDTPVYLHPNVADAIINKDDAIPEERKPIKGGQVALPEVKDHKYDFAVGEFSTERDHGTHLAGIIASRDNGFGLVGIDPSARLYVVNWDYHKNNQTELANKIEEIDLSYRSGIFVFASKWDNTGRRPGDRFKDNLANKIVQIESLWVVAAGDGSGPIDHTSPYPANLGDQSMVLVVTACEQCDIGNRGPARIMAGANFSERFVHIAAPGREIPSTITEGKYARTDGTSQAAAIVAGVASAIVGAFPGSYNKAYHIKKRLQITSRPFGDSDEDGKLAAGVVDAKLALLDPRRHWIKQNQQKIEAAGRVNWCVNNLTLNHSQNGNPETFNVEYILRIMNDQKQIWLYRKKNDSARETIGDIEKLGPFMARPQDQELSLFFAEIETQDGVKRIPFKLKDIEDLLLSGPVREFTSAPR